ncbi:MAG: putative mycofactocin radical SAM maturase MftC [Ignavibacteriaceae bacterium]|nr:putative mycofactocin radical SAM maturase MftC [Ignavibacteriaceae bacterium]
MKDSHQHIDTQIVEKFKPTAPYHMVWLTTKSCNSVCLHCSSDARKSLNNELSTEEGFSLIDQLADFGVLDIAFSGGESLMRKDIYSLIKHASNRYLNSGLGTNGWLANRNNIIRLKEAGLKRLQVSIDGLESTHDNLRCWPGLFKKAIKAIKIAKLENLATNVCFTVNKLNVLEIKNVLKLVASIGIHKFNLSRFIPTGRGTANSDLDLDNPTWERFIVEFQDISSLYSTKFEITTHLAQQSIVNLSLLNNPGFIGCQAGIGQGCISPDGYIFPCVMLPIKLGNIRQESFGSIWRRSSVINSLRKREVKGNCGKCVLKSSCGGCRAVAYAKTGDFLEEDPRCWL